MQILDRKEGVLVPYNNKCNYRLELTNIPLDRDVWLGVVANLGFLTPCPLSDDLGSNSKSRNKCPRVNEECC